MQVFDSRVHMHLTPQMVRACEAVLADRNDNKNKDKKGGGGGGDNEVSRADMEFLVRRSGFCPTHERFEELSDIAVKKCGEGPLTTADFWEMCDVLAGEGRWYGECAQGELDEVTCMLLEGIDGDDITKFQLRELLCGGNGEDDKGRLSSEEYEVFWAVVDKDNKGVVKVATIPDCIRASTADSPLLMANGAQGVEYSKCERDLITTTPPPQATTADGKQQSSSTTKSTTSSSSAKKSDPNRLDVDDDGTRYHALLSPNHERNRPPPIALPTSTTTRPNRHPPQDPAAPVQNANSKKDGAKKEKSGGCCLVM